MQGCKKGQMNPLWNKKNWNFYKKASLIAVIGAGCAALFIFCYRMAFSASNERVTISVSPIGQARSLATNQGEKSIVSISYEQFSNPQNIFHKAKTLEEEPSGHKKFLIGNIFFTDPKGNKDFICDTFPSVQLVFEAEGLAVEGERVLMNLISACRTSTEHEYIGPFTIPSQQILQSPIDKDYFEYQDGEISFANIFLKWPRNWVLMEAHFKQVNSNKMFKVIKDFPKTDEPDFFIISL